MTSKEAEQIDNEINLFELIESLWKERVLIIAITAVITLIGLSYAISTPATYEARVEILPPSMTDIAELYKFDVLGTAKLKPQSQSQVFIDFISILKSNQFRKKFLQEEGVMESLFKKETTQQQVLTDLDNMIKLEVVSKKKPNKASLKFQYKDSDLAAKSANQLVDLAIELYRTSILLEFNSIKDQKIKQLNNKKSSLIAIYEYRLDQEISKLKEAYLIAKKLDIIEPRESKDQTIMTKFQSMITEEMRYLYSQGARALNAEIETLEQRKKNPSMVSGLIDIDQKLSLLNNISFDASKFTSVTIDLVAENSYDRIKPKRTSIVLMSGVIGGFLAILFVLIRNAVRNRKSHF